MADPKKALEELKKKYGGSRGTGSAATDPKSALENLKQKYTPKTPVLADRGITLSGPNYQQPLVAPRVSDLRVKDQGNLLSMDVAAQKNKRADVDDQIEALEAEKRSWENEKAIWENSQFRGQKWDEADKQIRDIQGRIDALQKSTFSQDVIDEAQSWQKAVADYRAQKEEDERLVSTTATQNLEQIAGLEEQAKVYELQIQQLQRSGVMKGELYEEAQKNYQDTMKQIDELRMGFTESQLERAVQLQKKAELEGAAKYVGFANMSKYDTAGFKGAEKVIVDGGYEMYVMDDDERIYRLINKDPEAIRAANANKTAKGIDETYLTLMTPEQTAIYNYWYKTNKAYADEYLEMLKPELLRKQMMPRLEDWAATAEEKPVAASAISVGLTFASLPAYIVQVADYIDDRKIEENAAYNFAPLAQKTIRDTVGTKIEEKLGEKWGKAGSFAYQLGMSMADFLAVAGVGAGGMGTVILGGNAAAQTTLEAKARGLTDGQALALGTISGVAEWATETWSVEKLLDMTALGKSAGGYMLQNITAEGSEEGISGLVNLFADVLISKDKSQWQQAIDAYIQNDYDEKSAFAMALSDQVMAIGLDVIGGGISGGLMSAGGVALNEAGYAMSRPSGAYQQRQELMDAIMKMAEEERLGAEVQTQEIADQETQTPPLDNLYTSAEEAGAKKQDVEIAERISKATGRKIVFYEADPSQNGYYADGVIHINTRADDPLAQIISHEMTHSVELSGVYSKLSAIVLNRIQQTGGNLEQMRQDKIDLYRRNGVTLSDQRAVDAELVAEYVAKNLLTDEAQILQMVQNDRSLAEKIRDWISGLLAKLGNEAAAERAFLTQARDLYSKALQQTTPAAQQTADNSQINNAESDAGGDVDILQKTLDMIQFSISDPNKQAAMIGNLRQYLNGGMSIQELNQKIGGRSAQQAATAEKSTLSTEAKKIKNAARRQQMSVEQYLQSNWELFDVDGEWNQAAREALDDERGARYSFAGERARTASEDDLNRAKQMKRDGNSREEIFRETGWFQGADGKWRFEINDSNMQYDASGDLKGAVSRQWALEDLETAKQEMQETLTPEQMNDVRRYNGAKLRGNEDEIQRLYEENADKYGEVFTDYVEALDRARTFNIRETDGQRLEDFIAHDELFEAYPRLRDVKLQFDNLEGASGGYNPRTNTIRIDESLRSEPERTLVHEIQHAIQNVEGFATGSSPEYWKSHYAEGKEMKMKQLRKRIEELESQLPGPGGAWTEEADRISEQIEALEEQILEVENGLLADGTYLYRNTAGEIEARDAARRRMLTDRERRVLTPDIGDENTVFARGNVAYSITEPFVDSEGNKYEAAVLLDTDAFDGVAPRSWWKVLKEKIENRVGRSTFIMPVLDENGEIQNLEFARPEDRVRKNDSKEHSVISELYQTSDNISKLAAIHVDEVVEVSGEKEPYYTGPDGHGWLDENGWLHRTAYVINSKNGNIYQITMDIAKARDGRVILYALNGKTKKVGTAKVNSLKLRGSTQRTNFEDRVSRDDEKVKYSFSEEVDQIEDEHEMAFDALLRDVEREQETQTMRPERLEDTRRSLESYMDMQDRMWAQEAKEEQAAEKISAQFNRRPTSLREDLREAKSFFMRKMVDAGEAVARIGKAVGDKGLYHYYNLARASSNAAINMIIDKRTDTMGNVTGDGLDKVLKTVREKGNDYYKRFQLYLYHMHNIDRMSREDPDRRLMAQAEFQEFTMTHPELSRYAEFQIEQMAANPNAELYIEAREYIRYRDAMRKAENTRNKPVFGFEVTAEDSRAIVQRLVNEHPEFAQEAQKVYDYIDNLLRYRVDSGLITEEDYEMLKSIYPHYVPTYRSFEWDNVPQTKQKGKVQIGKTIQRASGGDAKLMPLHKALSQQTMSVVREGSKNRFGQRLMKDNENGQAYEHIYNVAEYDNNFSENTFDRPEDEEQKKTNTFVVRQDGKLWELTISPALYEAVQALSPERDEANAAVRIIRKGNDLFKKLVTGYNPTFLVRNFMRDLQDAGLYSKDLSEFVKQYPQAIREMQKDGKYWQQYKALGGTYSSVFDYETGDVDKGGRLKQNTIGRIEALNQAIEQAPRLAEFMATVKKAEKDHGQATMDDLMEAMYNAADITVNFGRAGTLGKKWNANFVPFLNPGIQGFSKMVRSVTETKGLKDWTRLVAKAALFGVAPMLLNALIYSDDDEWDDLKDRDKDVYYLFKIRDGLWLKLPKGRTLSLLGMTADRALDVAKGEDVDWGGYIETVAQQSAPANPFENNILAAAYNTHLFDPDNPGETWYGTDIESQRLQNYAPSERYDASTDVFSKWLGKVTKLSPAKINYLLDQYTGVAGDLILPLLSPQAERDMFSAAFTIDSNYSNRFSNEFYEMADELTYRKNMPDATGVDNILNRFWSRQSTAISEVNKAIREIEADTELKNKDKKELTAAQYGIRNALMENALETLDAYTEAAEYYYNASTQADEDNRIDEAYRQANREIFGAEYAIKAYNKDVHETATEMLQNSGISFDAFYDFYFAQKDIEATGYEKTNEKRNLIMQSGLTDEQKEALYTKYVSDTRADDIAAFRDAGMGMDTFMQIQNQYAAIENMKLSSSEKRTEFSRWLFKQPLNAQQDAVASEVFNFYSHISAQESKYEQLINAGVSDEDAYSISNALFALEPEEGKDDVSARQKYKAIADEGLSDEDTMKAFSAVMTESEYKKVTAGFELALSPRQYANVKYTMPQFDENQNGSYSNAEVEAAIDAYAKQDSRLDNGDKAILWQMITGNTSAKNNPYSRTLAERYLEELSKLKGEE